MYVAALGTLVMIAGAVFLPFGDPRLIAVAVIYVMAAGLAVAAPSRAPWTG